MKILFAVSNEKSSQQIIKKYESMYKEIVSSKNVYYFNAIVKELQKDKSYDRVVISEDLEPFTNKNYEVTDNFIFEKLDKISDEAVDHSGVDTPIILIAADRRTKGEAILNKLFAIGIYNVLLGQDRTVQNLCELINKPRTKREAKIYYKIDAADTDYKAQSEDYVSETEIQNILAHYKKLGRNEEKYIESFNSIANQYTDQQLRVIIKFLPIGVKAVLEANSPKYQQIATFTGENANLRKQKPYSSTMINPKTNKPRSTGQAVMDNGIKIESINGKEIQKPNKPVLIPNTLSTQNVRKMSNNMNQHNNIADNKTENEEVIENPIPKRRRGRPRKVLTPEEQAELDNRPKRGRGRPKKYEPENNETDNLLEAETEDDNFLDFENENNTMPENSYNDENDNLLNYEENNNNTDELKIEDNYDEDDDLLGIENNDDEEENEDIEIEENTNYENNDEFDDILEFDEDINEEQDNQNSVNNIEEYDEPKEINDKESNNKQRNEPEYETTNGFLPGFNAIEEDHLLEFDEPTLPGFEEVERDLSINQDNYKLNQNEPIKPDTNAPKYEDIYMDDVKEDAREYRNENKKQEKMWGNVNNTNIENDFSKEQTTTELSDFNSQRNNNFENSLSSSDRKIVAFVGTSKNGTSFLINNLAEIFSTQGIKTAILDLTKNKNSYYIYTKNEEALRKTAMESITKLAIGTAQGIAVNNNLDVYTALPGEQNESINEYDKILNTLTQKYSIILLDCDFSTNYGYLREAKEIYLVQSMDVLTIQPLTAYLRDLKAKNVLEQEKIRIVINKATRVRSVTEKTIIGGMAFYNDPSMSFMTELFNREKVRCAVIPFEVQTYSKYLEGLINCSIRTDGYSKEFLNELRKLANMVYPLINNNFTKSKNNKFPVNNTFSPNMNSTLDKMKRNY